MGKSKFFANLKYRLKYIDLTFWLPTTCILGALGFVAYQVCVAPIINEDKKIEKLTNSFLTAVNQKENKLLKEFFVCQSYTRDGHYYGETNYNFMETIVDKVLEEGYELKEFKTKADLKYLRIIVGCGGRIEKYEAEATAKLVSKNKKEVQEINGTIRIECRGLKCDFQISKINTPCPTYSK